MFPADDYCKRGSGYFMAESDEYDRGPGSFVETNEGGVSESHIPIKRGSGYFMTVDDEEFQRTTTSSTTASFATDS